MSTEKQSDLKLKITNQLLKALDYLDYSYKKISKLPTDATNLDQESLETWESFAARFSRVADIFISKYIRTCILEDDPGFRGSFHDTMNRAEKLGLIDNVETWMVIRGLRNMSVHEYAEEDLAIYFANLKKYCLKLLSLKKLLEK